MAKPSLCAAGGLLIAGSFLSVLPVVYAQSGVSAEEQQKRDLFLQAREENRKEARSGIKLVPSFLKAPKSAPSPTTRPTEDLGRPSAPPAPVSPAPPTSPSAEPPQDPGKKKGPLAKITGLFRPGNGKETQVESPPEPQPSSEAPPPPATVARTLTPPSPSPRSVASSAPPSAQSAPTPKPAPKTQPATPKPVEIVTSAPPPQPKPEASLATTPPPAAIISKPSPTLTPAPAPAPAPVKPVTPPPPAEALVKSKEITSPPAAPMVAAPTPTPTPSPPKPEPKPIADMPSAPLPVPVPPAVPREVVTAVKTSVLPSVAQTEPAAKLPVLPDVTPQPPEPDPVPDSASFPLAEKSTTTRPNPAPEPAAAKSGEADPADAGIADLSKISIAADNEAEFDLDTGSLIFVGHAVMQAPNFKLEGDRITVNVTESGDGIKGAHAVGSVKVSITSKEKVEAIVGQSAKGEFFDPGAGSFTLIGWPEVSTEGKREIASDADTTIILYTDGRVETIGETQPGIGG